MKYTPINAKEAELQVNPFQPGIYNFSVNKVEEKKSKSDHEMLEVELLIKNKHGKDFTRRDWIVLNYPGMEWKFRHFCLALGLEKQYESQDLVITMFYDKVGLVKLDWDAKKLKETGDKFLKVIDYLKPDEKVILDDEIPF